MTRREIFTTFGAGGIRDMAPAYGRLGAITDDTQMALFTAEGVLRWVGGMSKGTMAPPLSAIGYAYLRWLHTQGEFHVRQDGCLTGRLIGHCELFSRRAPGKTCLSALRDVVTVGDPARNDRKGCGGVMRVAPIGMLMARRPNLLHGASSGNFKQCFDLACGAAGLTHGHPTGKLAAGAFAALIFLLLQGKQLAEAIGATLSLLEAYPDHGETSMAIREAVRLGAEEPNRSGAQKKLGEGWVADEALAISLYCALCATDFENGVIMAVNHDGDSDSTGLMTGHILGAMHGLSAIPTRWLAPLELRGVIEDMADDLATAGSWRPDDCDACADEDY